MSGPILSLLQSKRVVICGGSGGVGKTTTAAALGLLWSSLGRRVMVITIDPARRLADALGLPAIGTSPTEVASAILEPFGLASGGSLSAMMLQAKSAWDELIRRYSPSPEATRAILANRFYQSLSDTFAGSHEYLALEKLHELYSSGRYDALVVDTPPTKHALDFLEAPHRMNEFLDKRVIRLLVMPYLSAGRKSLKLFNRTASFLFRKLEEATGIRVIRDVSEFFFHFSELTEGSKQRMHKVFELLKGPESAFLLVTSPEPATLGEARYFLERVADYGVPFAGVVANRVRSVRHPRASEQELRQALQAAGCVGPLQEVLVANYVRARRLALGDEAQLGSFASALPPEVFLLKVPLFPGGLQDLSGLARMVEVLRDAESVTE
jgi:anion-transporting  ArsA/GET3 family ATPase